MAAAAPARSAPARSPSRRRSGPARSPRRTAAPRRSKPRANRALTSRSGPAAKRRQRRARRRPRASGPHPRPFAQPAAAGAALIPQAVGRTAVAVRDLSDSGLIVRMTRGRLWIGVLGALLIGIVALNVVSLGLNASSGRVGQRIESLEQSNSALRAELADQLSSSKVEAQAAYLGLVTPDAGEVIHLDAGRGDAGRAADALGEGYPIVPSYEYVPPESGSAPTAAPVVSAPAPSTPPPAPAPSVTPPAPPPSSGGSGGGIAPG